MPHAADREPVMKLIIKNTFIEVDGSEDAGPDAVGGAQRRNNSCPPLRMASATSWADLSDDEGLELVPSTSWQGAPTCQIARAPKEEEEEKKPTEPEGVARTPLRSAAALFHHNPKAGEKPTGTEVVRTPLRSGAAPWSSPKESVAKKCGEPLQQVSAPVALQAPAVRKERTTLMMRNLPCSISRAGALLLLDSMGFAGHYDFFYLPVDFKTGFCVGYAFVNLTSEEQMLRFVAVFDGFRDWPKKSSKVCSIAWPETQGLAANVDRFQNSPVMSDEVPDNYKPALFVDKKQVPFPKPTRQLCGILYRS